MSLLRLVLACLGVLETMLATVGTVGMRAGSVYTWAGARNDRLGMCVICPPRKRTEPRHGSWLSVVVLRFCVGCVSVAIV